MLQGFIWWIVVGLIAGWAAGRIMKGGGYGVVADILLGIVGGIVGGWVVGLLGFGAGIGRVAQNGRIGQKCRDQVREMVGPLVMFTFVGNERLMDHLEAFGAADHGVPTRRRAGRGEAGKGQGQDEDTPTTGCNL